MAPLEKKNSWTLAEQAGEAIPDGMQRLLAYADWDADAVRDDVRGYVVEHLAPGHARPRLPHRHNRRGRRRKGDPRTVAELIPLTVPEVRACFAQLIWHQPPEITAVLSWSRWRRRHLASARRCHYAARGASP